MKIGIIREEKTPVDFRVVFSPAQCKDIKEKYSNIDIIVQSSDIRCFNDSEYTDEGITVKDDISECDILIGVKEVPIDSLIPNKKYFFFSHTYKEQEYNRDLLQAIIDKNIELHDYELMKNSDGLRVIFFGKWAGIVGAYNSIRTVGKKFRLFDLPKAIQLGRKTEVEKSLKYVDLPNLKFLLTGKGHVADGAKEILKDANIEEVSIEDYLTKEFNNPVFANIGCKDYAERIDGKEFDLKFFFDNPKKHKSSFAKFSNVTDILISGHYWDQNAPRLWELKDMESEDFKLSVIADITCDIEGSVPSTIRPTEIDSPIYGFNPLEGEIDYMQDNAIAVMAVDNLPCELAKDASEDFGEMFAKNVLPALIEGDKNGVLESSLMTKDGDLTPKFKYLTDYLARK
ncbi:MAG: alanine dehydrogenase [Ichthyobacteriaceae bacterium]|nr:alanine dehydrogenase [Ichthyobacteriaceae bacterium]